MTEIVGLSPLANKDVVATTKVVRDRLRDKFGQASKLTKRYNRDSQVRFPDMDLFLSMLKGHLMGRNADWLKMINDATRKGHDGVEWYNEAVLAYEGQLYEDACTYIHEALKDVAVLAGQGFKQKFMQDVDRILTLPVPEAR